MNKIIGVFDSGVGGLTVVKELKKKNPHCSILYYGDTGRSPWGNKSQHTIEKYALEISEFLIERGVKDIVIACNTASALAGDYLRSKYPDTYFYNVIDPVVNKIKNLIEAQPDKKLRIGLIGTRGTIESGVYEKKIKAVDPSMELMVKACPLFVPMVEEGLHDHKIIEPVIDYYLSEWKGKIDVLILGCTHYPLLAEKIKQQLGDIILISSAEEIASVFPDENSVGEQDDHFYFSDLSDSYVEFVENVLGEGYKKVMTEKILL